MRTLFLLFVLANCAFFAWDHYLRVPADVEAEVYGRQVQITPEKISPAVIFAGAAQSCSCFAKQPSTKPKSRKETTARTTKRPVAPWFPSANRATRA
mgnify:CR=1 FL=1